MTTDSHFDSECVCNMNPPQLTRYIAFALQAGLMPSYHGGRGFLEHWQARCYSARQSTKKPRATTIIANLVGKNSEHNYKRYLVCIGEWPGSEIPLLKLVRHQSRHIRSTLSLSPIERPLLTDCSGLDPWFFPLPRFAWLVFCPRNNFKLT